MFLAKQIINDPVIGYDSLYNLNKFKFYRCVDLTVTDRKKITENRIKVKSDYHKWLKSGGSEYNRDLIIEKNNEGNVTVNFQVINDNSDEEDNKQPGKQTSTPVTIIQPRNRSDQQVVQSNTASNQQVVQPTISNIDNTEEVLQFLYNLNWRDKDEGIMNVNYLKNIDIRKLATYMPTMIKLSNDLLTALNNRIPINNLTELERKNFLFHAMSKGSNYYYSCMDDPDFALYLLDQYQDLYTALQKILSR